jgi:hypothetical protein
LGDAPLLGSLCARAQKCVDVRELIVIHINFIRAMIGALDRGQLVPPKETTSQRELTSAPTAGKAHIAPSQSPCYYLLLTGEDDTFPNS